MHQIRALQAPWQSVAMLIFLLAGVACSSDPPPPSGSEGQECKPDLSCDPGLECILGTCQRTDITFKDGGSSTDTGKTDAGADTDLFHPEQGLPPIAPWVKSFGEGTRDLVMDLVATGDGGVCICGYFQGALDLGNYKLTAKGDDDLFVACFDAVGSTRWAKSYGSAGHQITGRALAIGPDGALYVAGSYRGTLDLGVGSISTLQQGIFLASFELDGTPRWVDHLGESDILYVNDLAIDHNNTCFITGAFWEGINLGQGLQQAMGDSDIFLTSYNRSHSDRWRKTFGSDSFDDGITIAVDSQGSVYMAGTFRGAIDFNQITKTPQGDIDIFLTTFSPTGVVVRVKRFGLQGTQTVWALAVDPSGNQYLVGSYSDQIKLAGVNYTASGARDGFLVAIDTTGTASWAKNFSGPDMVYAREIGLDPSGSIYLTGRFDTRVTIEEQTLEHSSNIGIFVAGFDASGAKLSARAFSCTDTIVPEGIAADGRGLLLTGNFQGGVDLGIGSALAKGEDYNIFVTRLASE